MAMVEVDPESEIAAKLHDAIRSDLERRAYNVENTVKRLITAGGGGRTYTTIIRRKNGKLISFGHRTPHTASAPGSPPATDTGRLLSSVSHSMGEDGAGQYARIGYGAYYGVYVELGTRYMAPRPALRPALLAAADGGGGGDLTLFG
jgi:hypothetical protein